MAQGDGSTSKRISEQVAAISRHASVNRTASGMVRDFRSRGLDIVIWTKAQAAGVRGVSNTNRFGYYAATQGPDMNDRNK